MSKRIEVDLLGRNLGTAIGWGTDQDGSLFYYGFEPGKGINLETGRLSIDSHKGTIWVENEDGNVLIVWDIVSFLQGVRKK